ncbi:MAG TPA: SAM-dependent methyltransferase [Anaerolineae bacterium]|nr:SAM-dependent methyltransferase [Anaerolineae bacterium]
MDQSLRNTLYAAVVGCRRLLEEDFRQQLEGVYGIHADGRLEPLSALVRLDAVGRAERCGLEAAVQHTALTLQGKDRQQRALAQLVRESAFTFLNRLAALKLMEQPQRALIQPGIGAGAQSRGFRQFAMLSPEALRDEPDGGYRLYLELLCDDLALTLGALFDRSQPQSVLFPTQSCLQDVLALLNAPELDPAWGEDETIGWIYQYFTPSELRDEARAASSAPRTAHELAFRNQFYTPRYVVAFLADNTLGRLWWKLRGGQTRLAEQCAYLIQDELTMSDLRFSISEPAIVNRQSKIVNPVDPRELRILDPACGSGHFLLYCFDLLLTIYAEAYDDPTVGAALRRDYPDREAFRRATPKLILEHNLHGIDIDRRAVQIAGLALWLRAQRAYHELGLTMRERPPITRLHIVCAEPMPGEYDLLGEFARDLKPAILETLLRDLWDRMRLAGEAGSLLKIEQEIAASITRARETLQSLPPGVQLTLFGAQPPQQLRLDPRELDDASFWADAEERVVQALHAYAASARTWSDSAGRNVTRRLFVNDAEQGIAFINLLRQRYDVVLMNPPFGAASLGSKNYIAQAYPRTKNDLYAAFVERGLELLKPGGALGAITSRTGFFLTSFQKWREEILLNEARLVAMADLGYGVLDTAMVETAAYVVEKVK